MSNGEGAHTVEATDDPRAFGFCTNALMRLMAKHGLQGQRGCCGALADELDDLRWFAAG